MSQPEKQINNGILLTIMLIGCFLSVLNQTILNVALPDLMKEFKITATTVQWLSTGFMLVNGILVPVTAFLMKRFTTRQLFISSMSLLLIGTFVSAIAPGFELLLTGRLIQAAGAGIIMPLLMMVVLSVFPPERRGTAMGMIGLSIIFAPAIGPVLAGFVIEHYSWRWLFIGMLPLIIVIILLALKFLVNVSETSRPKLDIISIILSTIGFGGILFGLSSAGDHGWGSAKVLLYLGVGIIFLIAFCWRQLTSADPLLNLQVFKEKMFTITSIILTLYTMIMYADMILLPLYLQTSRGFSVLDTGLLLLPGAVINAIMSPITGRLFDKFGAKPLALIGLCLITYATWDVTHLSDTTSFTFLMVRTIILRIGLSFLTMPINTAGLNALPKKLNAHGTAVSNTVRQLAGAMGTALVVTYLTTRTKSHVTELMESGQVLSQSQLLKEASILGTNDAYFFMLILAVITFILTVFMPNKKAAEDQGKTIGEGKLETSTK
ncbi:DHA2 family efflux MFS transporter permease subunit [Niallia oryzisoli]|uniref:DHA2 family efflux MFS transporter permease subunit n=1 Tax=Niallia oryzisoli TaxID=1737571 RepID=UPI003735EE36